MTQVQFVRRLEELERQLSAVKREVAEIKGKPLTSRDFVGMFHGDHDFKRAMELGAAYRRSLRSDRAPRKTRKR